MRVGVWLGDHVCWVQPHRKGYLVGQQLFKALGVVSYSCCYGGSTPLRSRLPVGDIRLPQGSMLPKEE